MKYRFATDLRERQIFSMTLRVYSLDFNNDEILKIIRDINIHKPHGHDDISITMMEMYGNSLLQPLILLFDN